MLLDRKTFKEIGSEYNDIKYVGENMFLVEPERKSGCGFMTDRGEVITEIKYDFHCLGFENGLCAIEYNDYKKGYECQYKKKGYAYD